MKKSVNTFHLIYLFPKLHFKKMIYLYKKQKKIRSVEEKKIGFCISSTLSPFNKEIDSKFLLCFKKPHHTRDVSTGFQQICLEISSSEHRICFCRGCKYRCTYSIRATPKYTSFQNKSL